LVTVRVRAKETTKGIVTVAAIAATGLLAATCSPGTGPESIPLPTSPDTTTTTSTTTTSTTTTTTTIVPPTYEATVRTTTDGVAHIEGESRKDLAFGQGYVSARDYGCTLLDQILKVRGERSAELGPGASGENIESDFAWRAIGIMERAEADFAEASPGLVEQFEGFAAGWNQFLADEGGDDLPGWCTEAEWIRPIETVEVYGYARSIALLASGANFTDFIASAQPPDSSEPEASEESTPLAEPPSTQAAAPDFSALVPTAVGSNAWAIGSDRIEGGTGGALVANPHFPWEGELRFAEVHLTVPGEIDIYGAQLAGLPGIGIGFTDTVAWSHTVSAGHRFTAYSLDLAANSPTTYLVDGQPQEMAAEVHTVEILRPDGTVDQETRTLYSSEYGPIIDFPGVGWSESTVLTYRDANIDNDEMMEFYADLIDVDGLDDLQQTHQRHQGVPLFNTVAVGADGTAWYADTSATPNLTEDAEQAYLVTRFTGEGLARAAFDQGVILLDGSDSSFRWEESDGARDPGLVPYSEQPQIERTDYVFNANDSFWVPHATVTLDGDFSILHGQQNVAQSMRTRQNASVLSADNRLDLAGDDDLWTADELRTATFDNTAQTATLLRESIAGVCRDNPLVDVDAVQFEDGTEALPAETVNLVRACGVLEDWDGRFDLDSAGAVLWRETMARFDNTAFTGAGPLFLNDFDTEFPTSSPFAFTTDPDALEQISQALARAVQTITAAGFEVDASMGAAQFTERSGERVPLHGGTGNDGVTNVISWSDRGSSTEPAPQRGELVTPNGELRGEGYPVNFGTSFVMVVDYSSGSPEASALVTYGNTEQRDTERFATQTLRYSEKNWRTVAFTDDQIAADPELAELTITQS
jgi:acyl-homoserine-lactone acylase